MSFFNPVFLCTGETSYHDPSKVDLADLRQSPVASLQISFLQGFILAGPEIGKRVKDAGVLFILFHKPYLITPHQFVVQNRGVVGCKNQLPVVLIIIGTMKQFQQETQHQGMQAVVQFIDQKNLAIDQTIQEWGGIGKQLAGAIRFFFQRQPGDLVCPRNFMSKENA